MNVETLRTRFAEARAAVKRARDAAESIGVSEGEAVAAHAGNHEGALKAIPLTKSWLDILKAVGECGPVLALTRNETTVHEKTGVYEKLSAQGPVGLALGGPIDLRMFFMHWHAGFAVTEAAAQPNSPAALSLQFYDASGLAVHKIYCREATDRATFEAVMQRFADASLAPEFKPRAPAPAIKGDDAIDADGLLQAWGGMKDTHDFFEMLKKFGVERQQSFRLAEGRYTRRAPANVARQVLQEAAFDGAPIMVFVGSLGCIQIHTGPVTRIEPMEIRGVQWLNVLDADFNLHLQEDAIANAWVVEKPTADGTVTSVELFDAKGELMAMFFGERKPGNPEREDWRAIVRKAAPTAAVAA